MDELRGGKKNHKPKLLGGLEVAPAIPLPGPTKPDDDKVDAIAIYLNAKVVCSGPWSDVCKSAVYAGDARISYDDEKRVVESKLNKHGIYPPCASNKNSRMRRDHAGRWTPPHCAVFEDYVLRRGESGNRGHVSISATGIITLRHYRLKAQAKGEQASKTIELVDNLKRIKPGEAGYDPDRDQDKIQPETVGELIAECMQADPTWKPPQQEHGAA